MTSISSYVTYALSVVCVLYTVCVFDHNFVEGVCRPNGIEYVDDADVRFALLLPLRTSGSARPNDCKISDKHLQHHLAVEWLIERVNSYNNGTGYIPGVKIGYTSYDNCGESIYSARNAISFLNDSLSYMSYTCESTSQTVSNIGIIGPGSSSSSLTVSSLIKDYPIPIISPMSTVAELSYKHLYPTFLRTVPSDEQQIVLIMDMLQHLKWTYIAVVYQDDDYGRSARAILTQKARENGICIHSDDLMLPRDDGEIGNYFGQVLESAHGRSIAVVVIVDTVRVKQLMYAVETRVSSYQRGLHFILMDGVNTDVTVFKNEEQGQATLSISVGSRQLLEMDDLKTYLNDQFDQYPSQSDEHPLIKEYIETYGKPEDAFVPNRLDSFLPSTIHAVMALLESLKTLHSEECITNGVCQSLKEKFKDGKFLNHVKDVSVSYSTITKDIVPAAFHDNRFSFSFNQYGDIDVGVTSPLFTVHSFEIDDYQQVGTYINGKTILSVSQINWLSPLGIPMQRTPSSMCTDDSCVECRNKGLIPVLFVPGDVYIVGIFSIHEPDSEDPFRCGVYRTIANDAIVVEGFLFAIEEIKKKTGIRFGAIGFDACYSPLRTTSILTDFFSDISPLYSQIFPVKIPREQVVGVIGCLSSGCTLPVSTFFTPLDIPVVSYAASSPDLDDRIDFPYFLRTVPSDVYQARVMVNIVKAMGWEYVGLLYVKNNYGAKGIKAFRQIVDDEGSGICAAPEISISDRETVDDADLFEARRMLTSQDVRVVIFFGTDTRARDFIKNLEKYKRHGSFIFLSSEDWGTNEGIKDAGINSARGSITLKLQTIGLESEDAFRDHLENKVPSDDDSNLWYKEFLQNRYHCHFRGSFHSEFSKECDRNQKLNATQIKESVEDLRARHVINAVDAMGKGLNEVRNKYCRSGLKFCDYLRSNPKGVVSEIQKQTRQEGNEQLPVFDPDGNGAIGYDVYNIQEKGGRYEYVQVGTFGPRSNELSTENIRFYDKYGIETPTLAAVCGDNHCSECRHRTPIVDQPVSSDQEKEATIDNFRDSDILLISLVGILILAVVVAAVALCICYRMRCKGSQKIPSTEDRLYEQIRQVYPAHFLQTTANLPVSNPNISPYVMCNTLTRDGVSNPTFLSDSDRIDSVSQVISSRGMNIDVPYSSSTSGNITHQNSIQTAAPTTPSSKPPDKFIAQRSLVAQSNLVSGSENDFQRSAESSVKYSNDASAPSTFQRQSSVMYSALNDPPMPLNAQNLQTLQNSNFNSDHSNVVLVKDANGQVRAFIPSSGISQPLSNPKPIQNLTTQSSSGNRYYGPYSYAAAQKQQDEQLPRSHQDVDNFRPSVSVVGGDISYQPTSDVPQTPYENIELQNLNLMRRDPTMNGYQVQPQEQLPSNQPNDLPTNQSIPIQYTLPTHQIISAPNTHSTSIPISRGVSMVQQPNNTPTQSRRTYSETASNTPRVHIIDPSIQPQQQQQPQQLWLAKSSNNQIVLADDHHQQQQGQGVEGDLDPGMTGQGQSLYVSGESRNSLSSIPDVISGKMPQQPTSPLKIHRDASLQSIDLETTSDHEQDLNKSYDKQQYKGKQPAPQHPGNIVASVV